MTGPQAPAWGVGPVEITRVEELTVGGIPLSAFLLDFEARDLKAHPWVAERFLGEGATMTLGFQTFAVRAGDRRIHLVDEHRAEPGGRLGRSALRGLLGHLDAASDEHRGT